MKILIIDDVDYIRKSISKLLEDEGFQCESARNGSEALEIIDKESYQLIITDIMMPTMDGFEFLDNLRNMQGDIAKTPVLAISGGSKTIDSDLALKMINEKADSILQKPFSKADLVNAVAQILNQK